MNILIALAVLAAFGIAVAVAMARMREREIHAMTDAELTARAAEAGDTDKTYARELDRRWHALVFPRPEWEPSPPLKAEPKAEQVDAEPVRV